jgi:hypothetical protein
MKLYRPHIPITTKIDVAARMCCESGHTRAAEEASPENSPTWSQVQRLAHLLFALFGGKPSHLDHDPPLMLRRSLSSQDGTTIYHPAANDPRYLIYRAAEDHKIKTFVRGDGAQLSDMAKRRKQKKHERKARPKWRPTLVKEIDR